MKRSDAALPQGPAIWICGDCHLSNLGPLADADGDVQVQIRDLDQTVIGNPAHDIIRLTFSLAMTSRGADLPGVITARVVEQVVVGYTRGLLGPNEKLAKPDSINHVLKKAEKRTWTHLAKERLEDTEPTIPLSKRFWPITTRERAGIRKMMATEEIRRLATAVSCRDDTDQVRMLDAAYWVKGCSSLGLLRYAVLLRVGTSGDPETSLCLLDIKQAVKASAPRAPRARMPRDNGKRIVTGACHLAPNLGERMTAGTLQGQSVFVRELRPQDLKIELDRVDADEAMAMARYLGAVVGRAHAAQMTSAQRSRWAAELEGNQPATLNAPYWLWRAVVELMQAHVGGYLEHCRAYATTHT